MKRIVLIAGALALWTTLGTTCYFATKFTDIKEKCNFTYSYKDINGNKGTSKHCFDTEDGIICRNKKHFIRAIRVEGKKVCK